MMLLKTKARSSLMRWMSWEPHTEENTNATQQERQEQQAEGGEREEGKQAERELKRNMKGSCQYRGSCLS